MARKPLSDGRRCRAFAVPFRKSPRRFVMASMQRVSKRIHRFTLAALCLLLTLGFAPAA
jgi:hypothetical protein